MCLSVVLGGNVGIVRGSTIFKLLRILLMAGVLFSGHSINPDIFDDIIAKIRLSQRHDADMARLHFSQFGGEDGRPASAEAAATSIHFLHVKTSENE